MKTFTIVASLLLFALCGSVKSEDIDKSVKTLPQWKAFVIENAKLEAIIAKIGKPDRISDMEHTKLYMWVSRVDNETTQAAPLGLIAMPYNGTNIVVSIINPNSSQPEFFEWGEKIITEAASK
ncbi:MAG: hypothetical protein ABIT76_15650 [Chthoniobacterales bacterium]